MTFKKFKVKDSSGKGHYTIIEIEDFEHVNPTEQISGMFINHQINFERDILRMTGFPIDNPLGQSILIKRAIKEWKEKYQELKSIKIPKGLI